MFPLNAEESAGNSHRRRDDDIISLATTIALRCFGAGFETSSTITRRSHKVNTRASNTEVAEEQLREQQSAKQNTESASVPERKETLEVSPIKLSIITYWELRLVTPDAYMAKIDIKDAYYSAPIKLKDQKCLKFTFDQVLYQFTVLPNGYSPGPRKFTKLLKPPLSTLRKQGVTVAAHIDDMFTLNKTKTKCRDNIQHFLSMLESLGFVIHPHKFTFIPSTSLEFLGFMIDSKHMTVSLTIAKKRAITELCHEILGAGRVSIRKAAQLGGKFTSCFIAVPHGKLHYRYLERDKTQALVLNKGNYDKMTLSSDAIREINWWVENIMSSYRPIYRDNPPLTITSDASTTGWGACCNGQRTGGIFSNAEIDHINILEAKAAYFGLQALCPGVHDTHIKILADNSATVGAINNMGSSKSSALNDQIHRI